MKKPTLRSVFSYLLFVMPNRLCDKRSNSSKIYQYDWLEEEGAELEQFLNLAHLFLIIYKQNHTVVADNLR